MHDHSFDEGIRRHLEVHHQFPTDPSADSDRLFAMHAAGDFGSEHKSPDDPMRRVPNYEELVGYVSSLQTAVLDMQPKVMAYEQVIPEIRKALNDMAFSLRSLETLEAREHADRLTQYGRIDEAVRALPYESPIADQLRALQAEVARLASKVDFG